MKPPTETTAAIGCSLHPVVGLRPHNATNAAQKRCAMWLAFCVDDGAHKATLDELEDLWWKHHDRLGNLKQPNTKLRDGATERRPSATET